MPSIYVAGPVLTADALRQPTHPEEVLSLEELYSRLRAEVERLGWDIWLPLREEELDRLSPRAFTHEILGRLSSADAVITVLREADQSTPVEAAFAAYSQKPQLVLAPAAITVPRIIQGLPEVINVTQFEEIEKVREGLSQLMRGFDYA